MKDSHEFRAELYVCRVEMSREFESALARSCRNNSRVHGSCLGCLDDLFGAINKMLPPAYNEGVEVMAVTGDGQLAGKVRTYELLVQAESAGHA